MYLNAINCIQEWKYTYILRAAHTYQPTAFNIHIYRHTRSNNICIYRLLHWTYIYECHKQHSAMQVYMYIASYIQTTYIYRLLYWTVEYISGCHELHSTYTCICVDGDIYVCCMQLTGTCVLHEVYMCTYIHVYGQLHSKYIYTAYYI